MKIILGIILFIVGSLLLKTTEESILESLPDTTIDCGEEAGSEEKEKRDKK